MEWSGSSSIGIDDEKQLGAGPHNFSPKYSSLSIVTRVPTPRSLGMGPRLLGRSSYLLDILFSKADASEDPTTKADAVPTSNDKAFLRLVVFVGIDFG
mmetsp:Transcript_3960/g.5221  ORF Transcript_3960/g.5221 Transcript_3960/m.5221 type:complete len:98 (-) Transcript_3960:182-475(-)